MTILKTDGEQTYWALASSSGTPIAISWSNLPARRRAASNESGRFVAPITITGLLSVLSHDISNLQVDTGLDEDEE